VSQAIESLSDVKINEEKRNRKEEYKVIIDYQIKKYNKEVFVEKCTKLRELININISEQQNEFINNQNELLNMIGQVSARLLIFKKKAKDDNIPNIND